MTVLTGGGEIALSHVSSSTGEQINLSHWMAEGTLFRSLQTAVRLAQAQ
jgi:hypothetical protein